MYLFFSFFFRYFVLVHEVLWPFINIHCTYLFLYVDVCFSFTYPFMCCFFSPFIHMLLITCMQSIYFYFTQRCLDEFCFKVFQKYRLSKSTCHKLSSCKVFQEFVIG